MLGDIWSSSDLAAEKLGISQIKLSFLRENGILKPGIHWKSSPLVRKNPGIQRLSIISSFAKILLINSTLRKMIVLQHKSCFN